MSDRTPGANPAGGLAWVTDLARKIKDLERRLDDMDKKADSPTKSKPRRADSRLLCVTKFGERHC